MVDYEEEQEDEFEALSSIFMEDFSVLSIHPQRSCMVALNDLQLPINEEVKITFTLPNQYPESLPEIFLPIRSSTFPQDLKEAILDHLIEEAGNNKGEPMIYTLVEVAKEFLESNFEKYSQDAAGDSEDVDLITNRSTSKTEPSEPLPPTQRGGKWDYVIGLVGKPSAGKSTFFNAATQCDRAKVGAHPFTTIDPNFSEAFYSIPDPAYPLGVISKPAHGKPNTIERYIPCLLKDVAGLVPGASEGNGRGNRFLNDLCDADVLIHVIDVSGTTNERGEAAENYDPCKDVEWLQDEIHQWIYNNVMANWDSIKKRPSRILDMFTGYHANKAQIYDAFLQAGIKMNDLEENLPRWDDIVLHQIVESFTKLRFPIMLALNKSDTFLAERNIERIQEKFPDMPHIAVSAKIECMLQNLKANGSIVYDAQNLSVCSKCSEDEKRYIEDIKTKVFERYGGTNIRCALNQAVSLRQPVYAFPVTDLNSMMSHTPQLKRDQPGVLADCISLKPGSTVETLFSVMKFHYHTLKGDFVRCEAKGINTTTHIVRKRDLIDETNSVIKIMTTKKS